MLSLKNVLKKGLFSFYPSAILLILYILACIFGTIIEHKLGQNIAQSLIYNSFYFSALHLALLICLAVFVIRLFLGGKYALAFLHFSFIIILIGAGITRFYGLDGGMHLSIDESSDTVYNKAVFLSLKAKDGDKNKDLLSFNLALAKNYQKSFDESTSFKGGRVRVAFIAFSPQSKAKDAVLSLRLSYLGEHKDIKIEQNVLYDIKLKNQLFYLAFKNKSFKLPFKVRLDDFIMQHYAGSLMPSYFYSLLSFGKQSQKVGINSFLDYKGYRFFQSAYDEDYKGSILAVNHDPGMYVTYLGYASLLLGFILVLFSSKSRFKALNSYLAKKAFLLFLLPFLLTQQDLKAELLKDLQASLSTASLFGELLIQDFKGRIKPVNSLSLDFILKLSSKKQLFGLNSDQLFLAIMLYPKEFKNKRLIIVKNKQVARLLGKRKYYSYNDFFKNSKYILEKELKLASQKPQSEQTPYEKELIKLDERVNIAAYILSGKALRIIPTKTKWQSLHGEVPAEFRPALIGFISGFKPAVSSGDFSQVNASLKELKALQQSFDTDKPSLARIKTELFLNKVELFLKLEYFYFVFSLLCFGFLIKSMLENKINKKIFYLFYIFFILAVILHALGLALRCYASAHAPWSDAYESMIFIAFILAFTACIFSLKQPFVLASCALMAGCTLFVAQLGFMDAQLSLLVPVLKSHWLSIHVSVISASYAFFGLCFILGCLNLAFFLSARSRSAVLGLTCMSELAMILGVFLLSVGNFLGAIWANESWGRYWGFDPKETWSLISLLIYALILHQRLMFKSVYVFNVASVLAFFSILMTYFGVNYYLSGLHSYGKGSAGELPLYAGLIIAMIFALIIAAFFKRSKISYDF